MGLAATKAGPIPPPLPPHPAVPTFVPKTIEAELGEWDVDDATLKLQPADADAPEDVEEFHLSDELWWGTKVMRVRRQARRLISMARFMLRR
jgi:hypothetical protein